MKFMLQKIYVAVNQIIFLIKCFKLKCYVVDESINFIIHVLNLSLNIEKSLQIRINRT